MYLPVLSYFRGEHNMLNSKIMQTLTENSTSSFGLLPWFVLINVSTI